MSSRNSRRFDVKARSYSRRTQETRNEATRMLLVCEGEKTEPNYFRSFRHSGLDLVIHGAGDNTRNLVDLATARLNVDSYDQAWCVFDRDSFPAEDFNAAISMASARGIRVAYSNEAFELWYILHFEYLQSALSRKDYAKKLAVSLGREYKKNDSRIYAELQPRLATAIQNARRLHVLYDPCKPEQDNPSTTVYLLVEELLKFAQR